jgi:membrane glycosyltransferase
MVAFVALAAVEVVRWPATTPFPTSAALALYLFWLALWIGPRLLGVAEAAIHSAPAYGGRVRLLVGGVSEVLFTVLLSPVMMVAGSIFLAGLAFRRTASWEAQSRSGYRLRWRDALARFWPQTVCGVVLAATLARANPAAIVWFAPFLAGLLLAVPFAVVTSLPALHRWAARAGVCVLPEEICVPYEIRAVAESTR